MDTQGSVRFSVGYEENNFYIWNLNLGGVLRHTLDFTQYTDLDVVGYVDTDLDIVGSP